ncbi:MAG: DUF2333 family protein [Thiofilum sp.]|uniref:DUF2333 family protein n=1 Tax=Thiofilum sp. TaxID=2212733 RepID=UPI0025EE2EAE|nr:DUF2333 family protein [Thiofilum sp.]MBK8454449.1 DUF2333 family protein [Thiofilum sp.]
MDLNHTVTSTSAKLAKPMTVSFWREKGWRWTVKILVVLFIIAQVVLMLYWSYEPRAFDVRENAYQTLNIAPNEPLKPGVITAATYSRVASTLLDKHGGYLSNDVSVPGIVMDNMPNWEFGVLTQVRDFSLAMRDDFSRSQSQSTADPDLVTAHTRFNTDHTLWLLPPAENQYRGGVEAVDAYLQRLQTGEATFSARSDNLNSWLSKVQRQLGSLSMALGASVGLRHVKETNPLAADTQVNQTENPAPDAPTSVTGLPTTTEIEIAPDNPNEIIVTTPRFQVDNVFYQARGQTWAILHLLKAIEVDFADILKQKNALVSLQQIINKLESTQDFIWSPIILNGTGYGLLANHSLVMASQVARANAALIDLGKLLREG